jgi:hypothetical protein
MPWWYAALISLTVGVLLGVWMEARRWREKGDHEYMNTKESGGHLYQVKREDPRGRRVGPGGIAPV